MPLDSKTIEALKGVTTATLTTVLLKKGLRNIWLRGTKPLRPGQPRIVGPAFTLRFVPAGQAPTLTDTGVPGALSLAWLTGWKASAGSRVLLGYVEAPVSHAIVILGTSANARITGRTVRIR